MFIDHLFVMTGTLKIYRQIYKENLTPLFQGSLKCIVQWKLQSDLFLYNCYTMSKSESI